MPLFGAIEIQRLSGAWPLHAHDSMRSKLDHLWLPFRWVCLVSLNLQAVSRLFHSELRARHPRQNLDIQPIHLGFTWPERKTQPHLFVNFKSCEAPFPSSPLSPVPSKILQLPPCMLSLVSPAWASSVFKRSP